MLVIDGITKQYKTAKQPALRQVSFSVPKGGFTTLLGENGAGKSTLINILSGTVKPNEGSIRIDGCVWNQRRPDLKLLLGIVPQEIAFDPFLGVEETLRLQAGYFGLRHDQAWSDFLLNRLSLWGKRQEKVLALSGGMKRRLLIAKALVHRPQLLLLDEPTAGVDVHLRQEMYAFLEEMNKSGLTIVLTTHYLEEAERLSKHVVLLHHGHVTAEAPTPDFLKLAGDSFRVNISVQHPELMAVALRQVGIEIGERSGSAMRLTVPRSLSSQFLAILGEHSNDVAGIRIAEPNLEDVFLKLTSIASSEVSHVAIA